MFLYEIEKPSIPVSSSTRKRTRKKIQNLHNKVNKRSDYFSRKIVDYSIDSQDTNSIFSAMENSGGFESRNLFEGVDILQEMIKDQKCTRFLSFVGAIISTGVRGIIRDMIKKKMFDCIITTCGAIDHDLARSFVKYYAGDFNVDD